MARTSGAGPDPVEPALEDVLGPEDAENEIGEDAPTEGDDGPNGDGGEGGDEADADGEGDEGAEDDVAAEPAPRRGGGSQTIRAQRARAQAAERELAEVKRQIAEIQGFQAGAQSRQQQPDPQAAARQEAEFYAQLELMPPAQAYQAIVNRERQQIGGALQQLRLEQQDLADQARYDASCARSPTREAYREKVEAYRQEQLRRGFIISRDESYFLLLGRDTEARASRAAPRQRAAAAGRIAGQQTRPTGARSNMSPRGRRPEPGSAEADAAAIAEADRRGIKIW